MKKKKMRELIKESFNDTPDLLQNIKTKCENIEQIEPVYFKGKKRLAFPKLAYGFLACILFICGLFIGDIESTIESPKKDASIYLDVNPSIEIQIDEKKNVIDCIAGNEDGIKILENISLKGVEIDTALFAIVGSMYTNGYLNSETNSILVSVDSDEDSIVLDDVSKQINNVFKGNEDMECSIIAQKVIPSNDLKDKALNHNISIGKMSLIEKIINKSDLYTEENIYELADMSIHELDLIFQSLAGDESEEIVSGRPSGFIEHKDALNYVINYLDIEIENLKWFDIVALYHHNELKERKLIYLVTILEKDKTEKQKFIVDCSTGEIMSEDIVEEWKDKIPNDGHFGGPKNPDITNDNYNQDEQHPGINK